MAYESFFYWSNWEEHLGAVDELGAARFIDSGVIIVKSDTGHYRKSVQYYEQIGVEFEDWDAAELARRCPLYDVGSFYPPKRPDDQSFSAPPQRQVEGAIFTPQAGYVGGPATRHAQRAAGHRGGRGRVHVPGRGHRDPGGGAAGWPGSRWVTGGRSTRPWW